MKKRVEVAHSFVLDAMLDSRIARAVRVNPMFGCHAIYVGDRIVLMLRHRDSSPRDNGMWVVVQPDSRESVRADFPELRPIELFKTMKEGGPTWLCLGEDTDEFESTALEIAELVIAGDERFGKVPKSASKSVSKRKTAVAKTPPLKKAVKKGTKKTAKKIAKKTTRKTAKLRKKK